MKTSPSVRGVCSAMLLIWANSVHLAPAQAPPKWTEAQVQALGKELSSVAQTLFELAAERHALNTKRNETWVLSTHSGHEPKIVTDGQSFLLSIPTGFEMNANGIKLFASHYNAFNIKAADQMVLAGKFVSAKRLYRLVERFDPGEINRSQTKERLALVERIEAAKNRAELLRQFDETQSRVGSVTNLENADPKKAQKVDDLLLMKP